MFSELIARLIAGDDKQPFRPDPLKAVAAMVHRHYRRKTDFGRLSMMRVIYRAQMHSVGKTGAVLFPDDILATTYGPLCPRMMDELGLLWSRSPDIDHMRALTPDQRRLVEVSCEHHETVTAAELMMFCEIDGGAWSRRYGTPARHAELGYGTDEGPIITIDDMRQEWLAAIRQVPDRREWKELRS